MPKNLAERLLDLPPALAVDLVMTVEEVKTGAEIRKKERDGEFENLMTDMGLVYEWKDGLYRIARSEDDLSKQRDDSVSRGRWFGIPECCIQHYQGKSKEELRKELSIEEIELLERGKSVPDEFYLGSMGYIPCSMECEATLERGLRMREALESITPRLWTKFRHFHIRRRLAEYGGEIAWWRKQKGK